MPTIARPTAAVEILRTQGARSNGSRSAATMALDRRGGVCSDGAGAEARPPTIGTSPASSALGLASGRGMNSSIVNPVSSPRAHGSLSGSSPTLGPCSSEESPCWMGTGLPSPSEVVAVESSPARGSGKADDSPSAGSGLAWGAGGGSMGSGQGVGPVTVPFSPTRLASPSAGGIGGLLSSGSTRSSPEGNPSGPGPWGCFGAGSGDPPSSDSRVAEDQSRSRRASSSSVASDEGPSILVLRAGEGPEHVVLGGGGPTLGNGIEQMGVMGHRTQVYPIRQLLDARKPNLAAVRVHIDESHGLPRWESR